MPMNDGFKQEMKQIITKYASSSLRTISLAYKDLKQNEHGSTHEEIRED